MEAGVGFTADKTSTQPPPPPQFSSKLTGSASVLPPPSTPAPRSTTASWRTLSCKSSILNLQRQTASRIMPPLTPAPNFEVVIPTTCNRTTVVPRYSQKDDPAMLSMDVVLSIYRELVSLINRLPFKQRLVVCIVYRGSKFRLDLGEVRAAGVACLIGLGLSLGTLLLYRLYFRIVVPFLNSVWRDRGKELLDDEYTLYLEPRDSEVDEDMGNKHSKKSTPSVYYAPGYGVVLGDHPPSLDLDAEEDLLKEEGIRLRPNKLRPRYKSPSPASDKDSAIGGVAGSEMSQSMYSENSAMRDSFYSTCTAESGFEEMYREHMMKSSSKGMDNFNPNSLRGSLPQLYKAHHGADPGLNNLTCSSKPGLETLSDVSSERSGIMSSSSHRGSSSSMNSQVRTNVDPMIERLQGKYASPLRTQMSEQSKSSSSTAFSPEHTSDRMNPSVYSDPLGASQFVSTHSSPFNTRSVRLNSQQSGQSKQQFSPIRQRNKQHEDTDTSQDLSGSLSSFGSDEIDWDADVDSSESQLTRLPEFQQSISDVQFQQSLMQRIHEWSTFAEEYNRSLVPSRETSPFRFVRRSKSLDRHLGDTSQILTSDSDLSSPKPLVQEEPVTEKNLETLEYELQDIQGEFESITSKLHELIEQGDTKAKATPKSSKASPSHRSSFPPAQRCKSIKSPASIRKMRTKWHVPSSACSDCSRSSRESSVEYAWDFADYVNNTANSVGDSNMNSTGEQSRLEPAALDADNVFKNEIVKNVAKSDTRKSRNQLPPLHVLMGVELVNIGLPIAISDHAADEWKGNTEKATRIREGYSKIPGLLSSHRLCVVRGDNYCGVRGALFQVLLQGHRASAGWGGVIHLMDMLHSRYADPKLGLHNWNFANRLPGHCKDRLAALSKCAVSLYATIEEVCNLPSVAHREKRSHGLFNSGATFDLELMEGVKLLMLLKLVDLQKQIEDGEDVPVFAHLLFARDTSLTVDTFLRNHLNRVGDTGGLEQVEMCLLGFTLGVRIRVLRLSQCGQLDFDCCFPDDVPADWPEVSLIAEDDRHYNVPLP